MSAGNLREKLEFQRRKASDDGFGSQATGDYETIFTTAAEMIPRLGGEAYVNARLQGVQPMTVRVRRQARLDQVGTDWRVKNARTGVTYDIVSPPTNVMPRGAYVEFLAKTGGPGQ
ncbi:putative phage head-tail adaptor [Roseibium sp. TrichSKD4]|uniref:head-tail adaptor protein n=1 Tax=Roseibium sp. TrichSKD4 TaxID=744980 RepID=UPI0001E56B8A|nr:head-tail adaptor protein [Roseibium sp. TrichSKD4]EFO32615.1 putative phage head-tail adaptor [Roseibium sp. TrichSKD4]